MNKITIIMTSVLSFFLSSDLLAQSVTKSQYRRNPYSTSYKAYDVTTCGSFFIEYNPHTWHYSAGGYSKDDNYHGISVGVDYFIPLLGDFGVDVGIKGQYIFREKKDGYEKTNFQMFSGTVPLSLAYVIPLSSGFSLMPYAGLYGRYNFSARTKKESLNLRTSVNNFNDKEVTETMNRFQTGWHVGADLRVNDLFTIGGGYWMDLSEIETHTKLRGFNIRLGANF